MISKIRRLKRVIENKSRAFTSYFDSRTIVLAYHRVENYSVDPQLLCVSLKNFEAQIRYISNNFQVTSLLDVLKSQKSNRWKIVITFDDGYEDNYRVAAPILKKYNCPATFFVTSGYLNRTKLFWWDELEKLLLLTPNFPSALSLMIEGKPLTFQGIDSALRPEWNVLKTPKPNSREAVYLELHTRLRALNLNQIEEVMQQLRAQTKAFEGTFRIMTSDEIKALSQNPLFTIGAHSVTHSRFSELTEESQEWELRESKNSLESILGKTVDVFAFPFGSLVDFSLGSLKLVKKVGYRLGCANYPGIVDDRSDHCALPRVLVRDIELSRFKVLIKKARMGLVDYSEEI